MQRKEGIYEIALDSRRAYHRGLKERGRMSPRLSVPFEALRLVSGSLISADGSAVHVQLREGVHVQLVGLPAELGFGHHVDASYKGEGAFGFSFGADVRQLQLDELPEGLALYVYPEV